jgi:hypothetical protein
MARQSARIDQAGKISEVDTGARDDSIKSMFVHLLGEAFSLDKIGNRCFHICQLSNVRLFLVALAGERGGI